MFRENVFVFTPLAVAISPFKRKHQKGLVGDFEVKLNLISACFFGQGNSRQVREREIKYIFD